MKPGGDIRPLPYPLNLSETIQGVVSGGEIDQAVLENWSTSDPDESVRVVLNLSLNEYVALASAIDVGRDIAYGDNSMEIWWIWIRALVDMNSCEDVADCIESDSTVQSAINNVTEVSGAVNPDRYPPNNQLTDRFPQASTQEIYPPPENCDLDKLWSGIREMVGRLDEGGRDLLDDLVNLNDKAERLQGIVDLVPILGDLIADVADFFTETIPDVANAYDAWSSEAVLDDIACAIFTQVCSECRYPTFEEVMNYYTGFAPDDFPSYAVASLQLAWNATKSVISAFPEQVYYAINSLQLFIYALDAKWVGNRGRRTIPVWCSLGEDVPTDNWIVLCDGCTGTWTFNSNFPVSPSLWTVANFGEDNLGVYVQGVGFESTDSLISGSSYSRIILLESSNFAQATYVNQVIMNYDLTPGSYDSGTIPAVVITATRSGGGTAQTVIDASDVQSGSGQQITLDLNLPDIVSIDVLVRSSRQPSATYSGSCGLNSIFVSGEGFNPFE